MQAKTPARQSTDTLTEKARLKRPLTDSDCLCGCTRQFIIAALRARLVLSGGAGLGVQATRIDVEALGVLAFRAQD